MRIENWSFILTGDDVYTPPERRQRHLKGQVYGHPKFTDGDTIYTSAVATVDMVHHVVTTLSGSVYELGAINPDYEKWCLENEIVL